MNKLPSDVLKKIPRSESDIFLENQVYDLPAEYDEIISASGFLPGEPVFELAAGSGRASSVLTHMGYNTIGGDITMEFAEKLYGRLNGETKKLFRYLMLDMEKLPFRDNSLLNVISINTLHELDNPADCLLELIRVTNQHGILTVGDFNPAGFDIMDKAHMKLHGHKHRRGFLPPEKIVDLLNQYFGTVTKVETGLNLAYVCKNKKGK